MYEGYYGLNANPFRLAPDPRFFYESSCHKRGLAYLRYGLEQGQGFVVVTGVPGTGKSLLVHKIFSELAGRPMVVASINNTNLGADDTLRAVANSFDVYCTDNTKAALLNTIERFLIERQKQGKRVLLIVDEAQNLPLRSLEELRMLSNFQIGSQPLIQIMLLGQQQLQHLLSDPSMEQFTQRVIAACHLKPLEPAETRGYIEHRLLTAGWRGCPGFSAEALALIHHCSHGIPRLINTFCDRLLLAAALDEKQWIDADHVNGVLTELQGEVTGTWRAVNPRGAVASGLKPLPDGEIGQPSPAAGAVAAPAAESVAAPAADAIPTATSPSGAPVSRGPQEVPARQPSSTPPAPPPVSDGVSGDERAVLISAAERAESGQPPPLEYVDREAIAAQRWWLVAGAVVVLVIILLLIALFVRHGGDGGHSRPLPPQQNQEPPRTQLDPAPSPAAVMEEAASLPEMVPPEPEPPLQAAAASPVSPPASPPLPLHQAVSGVPPLTASGPPPPKDPGMVVPVRSAVPAKPALSTAGLPLLLDDFIFAYESGDPGRIGSLFGENATVDSSFGRDRIVRGYRELFAGTDLRQIRVGNIQWQPQGEVVRGAGNFEITLWRRGSDEPATITGRLDMEVGSEDSRLVIRKLSHTVKR